MADKGILDKYAKYLREVTSDPSNPSDELKTLIKTKTSWRTIPFSKDLIMLLNPEEESFILFGNRTQTGGVNFDEIPVFTEVKITNITEVSRQDLPDASGNTFYLIKLKINANIYYKTDKYFKQVPVSGPLPESASGGPPKPLTIGSFEEITDLEFFMLPLNVNFTKGAETVSSETSVARTIGEIAGVSYNTEQKKTIDEKINAINEELKKLMDPVTTILNLDIEGKQIFDSIIDGKQAITENLKQLLQGKDDNPTNLDEIIDTNGNNKTGKETEYKKLSLLKKLEYIYSKIDPDPPGPPGPLANKIIAKNEELKQYQKDINMSQDFTSLVSNNNYKDYMTSLKRLYYIHQKITKAPDTINGLNYNTPLGVGTISNIKNSLQKYYELYKTLTDNSIPDPESSFKTGLRAIGEGAIGMFRAPAQALIGRPVQSIYKKIKGAPSASIQKGGKIVYKKKDYEAKTSSKGVYIVVDGKRKYIEKYPKAK